LVPKSEILGIVVGVFYRLDALPVTLPSVKAVKDDSVPAVIIGQTTAMVQAALPSGFNRQHWKKS